MSITALPVRTPHSVTDTRTVAADILADLRSGRLLDASFDRRTTSLDARDRRWTQELVWGLLRRREVIDATLRPRTSGGIERLDADLVDLLRLGTAQLLFMHSVPAYAAIAQTVELVKRRHGVGASKLANAVLRRVDRERDSLGDPSTETDDPVASLSLRHSHPTWLVQRWVRQFGHDATERLLALNNREAPVVLRPWGIGFEELVGDLATSGIDTTVAPLTGDSVQLPPGIALTELAAWRQGHCFVQDPAATLVSRYAALPDGANVGDFCAAPGGKAIEISRRAGYVVAADRSASRLGRVASNLRRLGVDRVGLVAMDATVPALRSLDAVLVDAPCTGTGTFRRHPDARWRLRISDLAILAATQADLLREAARVVRPGGLLVYSTCSLEPEENDEQVDRFLASNPDFSLEPAPDGVVPREVLDSGRLRVLPQVHGTDGSFAARFRRAA